MDIADQMSNEGARIFRQERHVSAPPASAPQRSDVGCSAWLDALRRHVDDMKARECEEARLRDEHRTRYEMVMKERMLLEDFIYKTERI